MSVDRPGSKAWEQWSSLVNEIDGFQKTGQVTALGKGRELEEKLLLAILEMKDESFYDLFEQLDPDGLTSLTMVEMVYAIEKAHWEYGTSPTSIGWLRWLSSRLNGKKPKERSELARIDWSVEQAQVAIDRLFENRQKRAKAMYRKFRDDDKGRITRERIGKAIINKYPETKEAGRVRLEFEKQRRLDTPMVADGVEMDQALGESDEETEEIDPFADVR